MEPSKINQTRQERHLNTFIPTSCTFLPTTHTMKLTACTSHCKNKLIVSTTEWLPWLQTNWRDSGYERFAFGIKTNCKRQPKGQLPSSSYNHDRVKSFITSVLPTLVYKFLMANLKCICNDSFTDVSVLWFDELGSWLMELLVAHQIFCYLQYGKAGTVCYIIIQPTFSHPRNYCSTSLLSSISQHNCASYTTPPT